MGNDVSVFEEGQLERDFWSAHGPKNESWTQFMARSFSGMTKILTQPKRMEYSAEDAESRSEDTDFCVELFTIPGSVPEEQSSGEKTSRARSKSVSSADGEEGPADLAAALWQQGTNRPGGVPRPLVIYLHTNTRCLVDAKEVLPLCDVLGGSLLAFDLPGCGKSDGHLTFQMAQDLDRVVQYSHEVLGFEEIVLWARGMATAIAVEYCSTTGDATRQSRIKSVVLDSPFTSVKQMVVDGSKAIKCFGMSIPETIVLLGSKVVRGKVCSRLGSDPFDVNPLKHIEEAASANNILPPCHIFSALDDDYIPSSHGHEICRAWEQTGAQCEIEEFSARHFGERPSRLVTGIEEDINQCLTYDKKSEEAAAIASLDVAAFMRSPSSTSSSSSIALGRVPWAGVW